MCVCVCLSMFQALRELRTIGESLAQGKIWKPTCLKGTRWIPHVFAALDVLVKNYDAVLIHYEHIAAEGKASDTMVGRAKQGVTTLKDHRQMLYIHLFLDILDTLKRY